MTLPSRITTLDVPSLYRNAVGLDRLLEGMRSTIDRAPTNYPPYNVIKVDDNNYIIEIACAGFTDKDISIVVENGDLRITGHQQVVEENIIPEKDFLYRGISNRKWERAFTLADHVEVKGAALSNGMLTVELERRIPEALKPRTVAITIK